MKPPWVLPAPNPAGHGWGSGRTRICPGLGGHELRNHKGGGLRGRKRSSKEGNEEHKEGGRRKDEPRSKDRTAEGRGQGREVQSGEGGGGTRPCSLPPGAKKAGVGTGGTPQPQDFPGPGWAEKEAWGGKG